MRTYKDYCKRKNITFREGSRQIYLGGVIGGCLAWIAFAIFSILIKPWVGIFLLLCGTSFLVFGILYFKK